jgi:hypothetical protein
LKSTSVQRPHRGVLAADATRQSVSGIAGARAPNQIPRQLVAGIVGAGRLGALSPHRPLAVDESAKPLKRAWIEFIVIMIGLCMLAVLIFSMLT